MAIFLIILFVLCVLLLLPIRVKAHFGDGEWGVAVYYFCFRVWHKESQPKEPPDTPPQPGETAEDSTDAPAETVPASPEKPEEAAPEPDKPPEVTEVLPAETEQPAEHTESAPTDEADEDTPAPEAAPEPETDAADADDSAEDGDTADPDAEPDEEKPEKPKKGIRGFIERLKPHSVGDALALAKDAFAAIGPAVKFLLRHFHFRHLKLYLSVGTDDAANTATLYGKICAAAFPLFAQLQCLFDIETDEFRILSDFSGGSIVFRASLELRVSPAVLILTVLILGVKFLWRTWRRFRREDKEKAQYEKESQPLTEAA